MREIVTVRRVFFKVSCASLQIGPLDLSSIAVKTYITATIKQNMQHATLQHATKVYYIYYKT